MFSVDDLNQLLVISNILEKANRIPSEYRFLLSSRFKKELAGLETRSEKLIAAAKNLAETLGDESYIDKHLVGDLHHYMKEIGLLDE